jgi:hypothetical protein
VPGRQVLYHLNLTSSPGVTFFNTCIDMTYLIYPVADISVFPKCHCFKSPHHGLFSLGLIPRSRMGELKRNTSNVLKHCLPTITSNKSVQEGLQNYL